MQKDKYLGIATDLPSSDPDGLFGGTLEQYGFPGGYEIVYVLGDGEDICAACANIYIAERLEHLANVRRAGDFAEEDYTPTGGTRGYSLMFDTSEVLAGYFTMDQTDSCAFCIECHKCIPASGCGYVTIEDGGDQHGMETEEDGRDDGIITNHGEYCRYAEVNA